MTPLQWKRLFVKVAVWTVVLILAFLLIALSAVTWRVFSRAEEARVAKHAAEEELADLIKRKASVEESLSKLSTERGIEEVVRSRYQLAKPGEAQIILVAAKEGAPTSTADVSGSWWDVVADWFR